MHISCLGCIFLPPARRPRSVTVTRASRLVPHRISHRLDPTRLGTHARLLVLIIPRRQETPAERLPIYSYSRHQNALIEHHTTPHAPSHNAPPLSPASRFRFSITGLKFLHPLPSALRIRRLSRPRSRSRARRCFRRLLLFALRNRPRRPRRSLGHRLGPPRLRLSIMVTAHPWRGPTQASLVSPLARSRQQQPPWTYRIITSRGPRRGSDGRMFLKFGILLRAASTRRVMFTITLTLGRLPGDAMTRRRRWVPNRRRRGSRSGDVGWDAVVRLGGHAYVSCSCG